MIQATKSQNFTRLFLGIFLIIAGLSHLSFQRTAFLAQVPNWVPINPDLVVVLSGFVEIILGLCLIFFPYKKVFMGWIVAVFFVAVFPGNIAQLVNHKHEFGLNSDLLLWLRLPLQPILIATVLWSTTAWSTWRNSVNNDNEFLK